MLLNMLCGCRARPYRSLLWALFLVASGWSGAAVAEDEPAVGLALGSGGAGGLAHIAMLDVFDDQDVQPVGIAGTSIGALMGALYADGLTAAEIKDIFDEFGGSGLDALTSLWDSGMNMMDILRLDLNNGGLVDPDEFLEFLLSHMDATTFEELQIPLQVVATDYWTGEMVVLAEGDLKPALQASMAVPGLFAPVQDGDKLLIDGGTTNPLPYDLLTDSASYVVAVDVSGARERQNDEAPGASELLFSTFEIMQQSLINARRALGEPDLFLQPDTSDIRLLHFNKVAQTLAQAEGEANKLAEELAAYLSQYE